MRIKQKTRLNRITTKTGDDGRSALSDGVRIDKSEPVFGAIGDIDELNVIIGMLILQLSTQTELERCNWIQQKLFDCGGELSMPEVQLIKPVDVVLLEEWITDYNSKLPPLQEFILPNGNPASVAAHHARTVCRRAERQFCSLNNQTLSKFLLCFINRLSDFLFVLARTLSLSNEYDNENVFTEEQWNTNRGQKK